MSLSWPIGPMLARPITHMPEAQLARGDLVAQPKWDGWRAVARIDEHGGVALNSRHGTPLSRAFPEVRDALHSYLPAKSIVDGEIVRWADEGRLDFSMVSRRAAASQRAAALAARWPCHLLVFDLLEWSGRELWREPFGVRRRALEDLFADVPGAAYVGLTPQTGDRAEIDIWLQALIGHGIEGVVLKDVRQSYKFNQRGWLKYKVRHTAKAVIAGITGSATAPTTLLLGRYDPAGRLRLVGRTTPLTAAARSELVDVLQPAGEDHPWPAKLPSRWLAFDDGRGPLPYVRATPDLVAEVLVDVARIGAQWRHRVKYLRLRTDLQPTELTD